MSDLTITVNGVHYTRTDSIPTEQPEIDGSRFRIEYRNNSNDLDIFYKDKLVCYVGGKTGKFMTMSDYTGHSEGWNNLDWKKVSEIN